MTEILRKPFFSVVIPTKGRAFLLSDTLNSVLNQDFTDFDLLVVDNDDSEETQEIIAAFDDPRIRYIRTGGLSMAKNWQEGLSKAIGNYVVLNADKSLLKKDALSTLAALLNQFPDINVIAYEYDAFYDEEGLYLRRMFGNVAQSVESQYLLNLLLESEFVEFAKFAPRGYNACISSNLLSKIYGKYGDICVPFNPDYTTAYHIVLNSEQILYLPYSLQIVRFRSLHGKASYGNGSSYFLKGDLFKNFLAENNVSNDSFCANVPIKAWMVYNILLDDFYKIAARYGKTYLKFNRVNYYSLNYKETMSRNSYGVDVHDELTEWQSAIRKESFDTRLRVIVKLLPQFVKQKLYRPYRKLEAAAWGRWLLQRLGRIPTSSRLTSYHNIMACLERETCAYSLESKHVEK